MPPVKGTDRPTIAVRVFPHAGCQAKLREIQAGIEEEGVQCQLADMQQNDAVLLAHAGAESSHLGVGVGVSTEAVCIHHRKLPVNQPLFISGDAADVYEWRRFGYNAARLVKGLPFKDKAVVAVEAAEINNNQRDDELYKMVQDIVRRIIRETGHEEVSAWSIRP